MTNPGADELGILSPLEHPAAVAWARARPAGLEPAGVALLKRKNKSAIYRLTGAVPGGQGVVAKRCALETARIERAVYAEVLSRLPVSSPRYYGWAEDQGGAHGWLFLEECVAEKYSPVAEDHRRLAGQWLGVLHTSSERLAGTVPLPDRGPVHYRQCLRRVYETVTGNIGNPAIALEERAALGSFAALCESLEARWPEVEKVCARIPRTLVHGDFIKRNLRVRNGGAGPALLPFDWEDAGWGCPAVDLARPSLGAGVDLAAYLEAVSDRWPAVDLATVHRWAAVGTLFRFLAGADWDAPKLATPWAEKAVLRLTIYRETLGDAVRALGWEDVTSPPPLSTLPDGHALAAGLSSILCESGDADGRVAVVDRRRNPTTSTFPGEIVTCRLADGTDVRLFCKYGAGREHNAHGHRGGVDYETEVYRRVVRPSRATAPRFYGARTDDATGEVWLVLGYLDGAVRLRDKKEPSAWDMAAARVGDFHAAHEVPPAGPRPDFPRAYDADYYAGWARRTIEYTRPLHQDLPWLDAVCRRFEGALAPLLEPSQTVIHGECYPMNLLCHGGEIYLVDWESAAVGPGEIDLATLTERCEADIAGRCELAYCRARWPRGAPASFARRLDLARLYVHFRWLGDGPGRKKPWRLEEVRTLGERLGLL